jgi:hypothetical protein
MARAPTLSEAPLLIPSPLSPTVREWSDLPPTKRSL